MGFGSFVEGLQTKANQAAARRDVVGQAQVLYDEELAQLTANDRQGIYQRFPQLLAARRVETKLVANAELFAEQLRADNRHAALPEICTAIIELVYDIKVKALEKDGFVNPFDHFKIASRAAKLESKVRAHLMTKKMERNTRPMSELLDAVEDRLIQDARREHEDYEEWMRATQAAILAVKTLRLQKLANTAPAV